MSRTSAKLPKDKTSITYREDLKQINLNAAGIDVGGSFHWVAVPADRDEQPRRRFECFTSDLVAMAEWLLACGVTTVAMESTGIYWIPVWDVLESHGLEVVLVDARRVKNVSGRKSDIEDCEWLRTLHTYGLLRGAFRPAEDIRVLRAYSRQREMLISSRTSEIQHMQKALQQMNIQLSNVISDVAGLSGQRIIRTILAGERDPQALAALCDFRIRKSRQQIAEALTGTWRTEHLFQLRHAVELYDVLQAKINECEAAIADAMRALPAKSSADKLPPSSKSKTETPAKRQIREMLFSVIGLDLLRITGISYEGVLKIISEIGVDLSAFETAKHFTAWLGLAPNRAISGGKLLRRRGRRTTSRAQQAFRMAAYGLARSDSYLGRHFRRLAATRGMGIAVKAVARMIAVHVYRALTQGIDFSEANLKEANARDRQRQITYLQKKAEKLGGKLVFA